MKRAFVTWCVNLHKNNKFESVSAFVASYFYFELQYIVCRKQMRNTRCLKEHDRLSEWCAKWICQKSFKLLKQYSSAHCLSTKKDFMESTRNISVSSVDEFGSGSRLAAGCRELQHSVRREAAPIPTYFHFHFKARWKLDANSFRVVEAFISLEIACVISGNSNTIR